MEQHKHMLQAYPTPIDKDVFEADAWARKKQMFLNDAEETENQWRSEIQEAATANVGFSNLEFERDLIYNWQLEAWIMGVWCWSNDGWSCTRFRTDASPI